MRYCTNCGKQIADYDLFCSRCGAATSIKNCPCCGNVIGFEDIYCKYCGKDQSAPVSRESSKEVYEEKTAETDGGLNKAGSAVYATEGINPETPHYDTNTGAQVSEPFNPQPQYRYPQAQIPQSPYQPAPFTPMQYPPVMYQQMPYPPAVYAPMQRKGLFKKGILPLFIWSLILVAMINPVGTALSAVSTFYLLSANADAEYAETGIRKKKSLILNIAASAIDLLTFIVLFIMVIKMR